MNLELTVKLDPIQKEPAKEMKAGQIVVPLSIFDEFSEEELKYYATPYFDELQEKKRLMEEIKKNQIKD